MAERSNAAVLKTVDLRGSGGSNPSLSTNPQNFISQVDNPSNKKYLVVYKKFCISDLISYLCFYGRYTNQKNQGWFIRYETKDQRT